MSKKEIITDINNENYEEVVLNNKKIVMLVFYRKLENACIEYIKNLEIIAKKYRNVKIAIIDVDTEEELANNYGITSVPCSLLIKNSVELYRYNGYMNYKEVKRFFGKKVNCFYKIKQLFKMLLFLVLIIGLFSFLEIFFYSNKKNNLKIKDVIINSSNISNEYVTKGDQLNVKILFNENIPNNIKVFINNKMINYDTLDNSLSFKRILDNENKLELTIYYKDEKILSQDLAKVDNEVPKCTLVQNGDYLELSGKDNNGILEYAFSKTNNYKFIKENKILNNEIGLWYGYVKDYAGNIGKCSYNVVKKKIDINPINITIVGDSRMVYLCQYDWYKKDNSKCIARGSMGYNWLVDTAINEVNKLPIENKKYLVTNLGVNDLDNIDKYIAKYQELVKNEWRESQIYLLSVNPADGNKSYFNSKINNFNKKMKDSFSNYGNVVYCDSNGELTKNGFQTTDGIHYTEDTSKKIYEIIKKCIYDNVNK